MFLSMSVTILEALIHNTLMFAQRASGSDIRMRDVTSGLYVRIGLSVTDFAIPALRTLNCGMVTVTLLWSNVFRSFVFICVVLR